MNFLGLKLSSTDVRTDWRTDGRTYGRTYGKTTGWPKSMGFFVSRFEYLQSSSCEFYLHKLRIDFKYFYSVKIAIKSGNFSSFEFSNDFKISFFPKIIVYGITCYLIQKFLLKKNQCNPLWNKVYRVLMNVEICQAKIHFRNFCSILIKLIRCVIGWWTFPVICNLINKQYISTSLYFPPVTGDSSSTTATWLHLSLIRLRR